MPILAAELSEFVVTHAEHGRLEGDAGELTPNGYRLVVTCSCGVTFHRWITPQEAAENLAILARTN
jgi:hypothetical protein